MTLNLRPPFAVSKLVIRSWSDCRGTEAPAGPKLRLQSANIFAIECAHYCAFARRPGRRGTQDVDLHSPR